MKGNVAMYNSRNKQFVFKDSQGKLWNFYYDINLGLCYSIFSKRLTWSEPKVIQSEVYNDYYVEIDKQDSFHIVYQDKKGNIIYSLLNQNEIAKAIPVLTSKAQALYNKHLSLVVANSSVHIFFIVEHNNTFLLSHQTIVDGVPVAPKRVDNIFESAQPYTVLFDTNEDIYAFYHISDGKNNQIGYKKFSIINNIWSEYSQITTFSYNCENPKVVIDRNGIFHICYQRKLEKQYQLVYQQKIPDRNMWTSESVLTSSLSAFFEYSMLALKNSLIVYWLRDELIYSTISNDLGSAFSKPLRGTPLSKQFICIKFKSNSPYEHLLAHEIPASFVNGFKLMFFNQTLDPESGLNIDEMKAIITTDLTQLKKQVIELRENQKVFMESIRTISTAQQNIQQMVQKELSKIMLMVQNNKSGYDAELSQVQNFRNQVLAPQQPAQSFHDGLPSRQEQLRKEILAKQQSADSANKKGKPYSGTTVSPIPSDRIPEDIRSMFKRKKKTARLNAKFIGTFTLKKRRR